MIRFSSNFTKWCIILNKNTSIAYLKTDMMPITIMTTLNIHLATVMNLTIYSFKKLVQVLSCFKNHRPFILISIYYNPHAYISTEKYAVIARKGILTNFYKKLPCY